MRAEQEEKGGRWGESEREEKKGTARHSYTKNKEMNHIQRLVEDGVCVLRGRGVFEGCFQDRFNVFTEGASEARPG